MPARHDLLVGALDFPWRPVGLDRDLGGRRHHAAAPRRRHLHDAGVGPPAPVRDGRRELPHRLRRLGLPARPRGRPVAHPPRPVVDRRAGAARPPAAVGARLRRRRTWFRDEADFPGPNTMAAAAAWLDGELSAERGPGRAGPARGRRVRPARALRRARAVGEPLRPRLGGRAPHLAAVREEPGAVRPHRPRERPPAQPVRRQALDDRPLARAHPRGRRPARGVGHHRLHPLHRPRPLPRRARALGQAAGAGPPRARPHPAARRRGRASRPTPTAPSPPPSTSTPRSATSSA